jgi:FixJ family two-component response regulator
MNQPRTLVAVVDDDASVCRALKRLLHTFGMDADTFSSGEGFLEVMTSRPAYDVACVVLDLQMPGMSGLQVQERLASLCRRPPIVFITAHDEAGARARALEGGAAAFVRKPFSDELFIDTLRAAIRGKPAGGS